MIRFTLENTQNSQIIISKEAEHLENYLKLEQLRFNDSFDYIIDIDPEIQDEQIPSMLIQPIVENAVIHGISGKKSGGEIHIRYYSEQSRIICDVTDNGIGREKANLINRKGIIKKNSMGLSIIEKRLETLNKLFNENMKLIITDLVDHSGKTAGTNVKLILNKINI